VPYSRSNLFWPLRLIAIFSVLIPALLFAYATWTNSQTIEEQANERIERALDVLQEHALKALQTVERAISETNEVLRGMSDESLREREADLFLRLKRTQQALPQIESIWAFDRDGHPLVSSTILPVPRNLNNSDRSYFRAQQDPAAETFVSEVVRARVGTLRFFVVSGRRMSEQAGRFNGVIGVTVMPDHFSEFYRKISRGRDVFGLLRVDGSFLARFPDIRFEQFATQSALAQETTRNPEAGSFTGKSRLDGVERRVGYRKVPGFQVYVQAGIETDALRSEFWSATLLQLALGGPVALAMFGLSIYALRRAQRSEQEIIRREIAESSLKQAQRLEAIGQLTGGVAHDFNNLLMVVSGNVERLKRSLTLDDRQSRAIEAISIAVKRGTDLTRQLLSFSRQQAHEAKVIDLNERLPAIREMLQSSLRGDITIQLKVPEDLWPIKVDSSELELSLLNLAVNARDAMSAGGSLTISADNVTLLDPNPFQLKGDFVALNVTDTGAGIPPEVLARVFEPFFTTKDIGKGTGLGLSQVYGFAQQAGGRAAIESVVGRGTTVTLYLPRSRHAVEVDPSPTSHAETRQSQRERGRVLLVEDNAEVADVTRELLQELGFEVLGAADVSSALSVLRGSTVDVILSDIVMPGGADGLDLARLVRREYGEGLPIILATGYSEKSQAATEAGFTILRKPYEIGELRSALAEALRKSRKRGAVGGALTALKLEGSDD
jgi:two-component system NtrC family sensor kinase